MEDKKGGGSQWAILPAMVRYDPKLPANAKLIYAEIAAKINEEGYCFAGNSYFAERFKLKEDTVSGLVRRLADAEYIRVDLDVERSNKDKRRIYLTGKPYDFTGGIGFKSDTGKKSDTVSDLNPGPLENIDITTKPPKPPKGGRRKKTELEHPVFQPERFEAFWQAYPRGEAKQRAAKAWDKLAPDKQTQRAMALGLKRQLESEDWKKGIGIPYASTWLNQRRWEDDVKTGPVPITGTDSGWAETREVYEQW